MQRHLPRTVWVLSLCVCFCLCTVVVTGAEAKYQRFCYIDTTAQLRPGAGSFTLTDLRDVMLCTHLVFVRALVDPVNLDLAPALDGDFDYYTEVTALKDSHPDLKILLLAGGPDPGLQMTGGGGTSDISAAFSQVVNSTEQMDAFVDNAVAYLRYFAFDGVELDWRYPGAYGSQEEDVSAFSLLVRKLRERFEVDARQGDSEDRLLLTARVSGDRYILQDTVHLHSIIGYVDYLMVSAYDFYLTEPLIGHNSGLYGRDDESPGLAVLNADHIVQYLTIYKEVPAEQIILGVPSFGRTVVFHNSSMQAFGVPHNGTGPAGPFTGQAGLLAFYEICSLLKEGWTEVEDSQQLTPFAFNQREIVTYDNPASVAAKANYIKDQRLGGAALWDLSYDDFSGAFCDQGPFPLATALRDTLISPRTWCPAGESGRLDEAGCEPCPVGTYQPEENSLTCVPCPQALTTLAPGSTRHDHCILACESGSEFNYVTSKCDLCPLGFYRMEGRDPACLKCPEGHTTVSTFSKECVPRPDGIPKIMPRQIDVRATLTFKATSCENKPVVVGAIRLLIADYFQRLARIWTGLCPDDSCDNVISDVIHGCGDDGDVTTRKRRSEEKLIVSVTVGNVSEEVNNTESTRQTHNVIAYALSDRQQYDLLGVYGIQFQRVDSLDVVAFCEAGSAVTQDTDRCEMCGVGTYHDSTVGRCVACPVGHYQHLDGQSACWSCQGGLTTVQSGSASAERCVSPCEARSGYCVNGGQCQWSAEDSDHVFCQCPSGYRGVRCDQSSDTDSASSAGTVVGAVVGGVLAFLIVVLIIIACCVCLRMRKAVQLVDVPQRDGQNEVTPNHYSSWGTFSKNSLPHSRGVKFVDYIDYYTWINNLSDQQQQGRSTTTASHGTRARGDPEQPPVQSTLTTPLSTISPVSADQPSTAPNQRSQESNGKTSTSVKVHSGTSTDQLL